MLVVGIPVQKEGKISEALMIYSPVEPISATLNSLRVLLVSATLGILFWLRFSLSFFPGRFPDR
jgi:hypothetical protein